MTTTQENLTYPYGTTPEEVIREAANNAPDPTQPEWVGFAPPDQLLTVLDALLEASNRATVIHTPPGSGKSPIQRDPVPMQLRIQILAALGIDEGGA